MGLRTKFAGQPPIDDQRFAMGTEENVGGLEIAVQHPLAVGVRHGVADVDDPPEKSAPLQVAVGGIGWRGVVKLPQGLLERPRLLASDQAHGVEGATVGMRSAAVDRDDAGMLKAAGDFGLVEEAVPVFGIVGPRREDLLEGDCPVEFAVERLGDESHAPGGEGPPNGKAFRRAAGGGGWGRFRLGAEFRGKFLEGRADQSLLAGGEVGEDWLELAGPVFAPFPFQPFAGGEQAATEIDGGIDRRGRINLGGVAGIAGRLDHVRSEERQRARITERRTTMVLRAQFWRRAISTRV